MRVIRALARRARRRLRALVDETLAPYATESASLREGIVALGEANGALVGELARTRRWLVARRAPFHPAMTVHEAWARHPGVRRIFSRHHLPACDACSVGGDETLAEAAFGYGLDPDALIAELNALLQG